MFEDIKKKFDEEEIEYDSNSLNETILFMFRELIKNLEKYIGTKDKLIAKESIKFLINIIDFVSPKKFIKKFDLFGFFS